MALDRLLLSAACGGGSSDGNDRDCGVQQTTLSAAASDGDGDALNYQWRVTGSKVDNRNASQTVWTLPVGSGLHFACATVSDGRGSYTEQQCAVSSDEPEVSVPALVSIDQTLGRVQTDPSLALLMQEFFGCMHLPDPAHDCR